MRCVHRLNDTAIFCNCLGLATAPVENLLTAYLRERGSGDQSDFSLSSDFFAPLFQTTFLSNDITLRRLQKCSPDLLITLDEVFKSLRPTHTRSGLLS